MEWLQKASTGINGNSLSGVSYPSVADLDRVECRMADRFNRSRVITRPVGRVRPEEFLCQYQAHCFALCNCCDFFACDCSMQCPRGCTCYHDATWSTNVIQCSGRGHSNIPPLIPMDATAIYMDGNNLTGTLESQAFIGRKKVRELYLNHSKIESISNQTFNGLTELEALHLDGNLIDRLDGLELQNLTSLRRLYLQHNLLAFIHHLAFSSLTSLELLQLEGNQLSTYAVWDLSTLPSLGSVHLSANPWSCACDFVRSFQDYASASGAVTDLARCECVSDNDNRVNLGDNVTCSDAMAVTYLEGGGGLDKGATATDTVVLVAVAALLAFVLVIGAVVVAMLMFRTPARVWLHSKYGIRIRGRGGHDKLYDAFVSYSTKDEDFVQQILLPQLEQEDPGYKLCLQHRDLPSNSSFGDVFPGMAQLCARHILVVSRPYLESEWEQVKYALQETKRLKLLVVLLEELVALELAAVPELNSLLKASPVIRWGEAGFWNKLRFHLPDPRLRAYRRNFGNTSGPGGGGSTLRGTSSFGPKLLTQQQQHQSTAPRYSTSGWHYDNILGSGSNNNSSTSGSGATATSSAAASPRTLTGGSSSSSASSGENAAAAASVNRNIHANPLAAATQWQSSSPMRASPHLQQQQHHTYQCIDVGGGEPIYHTLEPSPSPHPAPPAAALSLDQFDTLGRLDVMLPNGQFVPATLVRNHASGRLVPLVEVDTAAASATATTTTTTLPLQQQQHGSRLVASRNNNNHNSSSSSRREGNRRFL